MNRYREIKTLGKGSFGRAVLVQELATKKQYVMKIIYTSTMKPQERQEALQESKILEKLNHPNITAYKESFYDSRFLYIVMEFANGGDLHDMIRAQKMRGQLFEEDYIWEWFLQICLAVKHIHDRRILHRDLKTQNVFMSLENNRKVCKLGDFGVSKVLSSTLECARTAIGTPYYLSPELCNNQGYNNKSDIWALGCILYEMCTLQHTFEAANMKMLIVKILEGKYTPISSKYSQNMKDLVNAMLYKDPKKRPSINSVLRLNFVQEKLRSFDQQMLYNEFSHTVFHGAGNLLKGFAGEPQNQSAMPSEAIDAAYNAFRRPQDQAAMQPVRQPVNYPQTAANAPVSQVRQPAMNVRNYDDLQKQQQMLIERARQQKEEALRYQKLEQLRQQEMEEMRRKQEMVEKARQEYERKKKEQEERQRQIEYEQAERRAALAKERQEAAQRVKNQYESQWQKQLENGYPRTELSDYAAESRAQYMNKLKRENPRQYLIEVQKRKDEERLRELRGKYTPQEVQSAEPSQNARYDAAPRYPGQSARRYDPYAPSNDNPLLHNAEEDSSSDFGDKPDEAFQKANQAQNSAPEQLKRLLYDADSKDSLCYRMETLRAYMEKELGFDKFLSVYCEVQNAREKDLELDGTKVRRQLGDDNMGWLNLIVQLILVEMKFNECQ